MQRRRVVPGALVALLLGLVTGAALTAPPAVATAGRCAPGTGVTVVVDFRGAPGGGVQTACDPSGAGKPGNQVMQAAGFRLTYVSSQPGFVCLINSRPGNTACSRTPPANKYWGLFWSDGSPATWTYSNLGVGGLKVPAGGSIGWRFQNGGSLDRPGAAPTSAKTSGGGTGGNTGGSGGSSGGPAGGGGGAPTRGGRPPTGGGAPAPRGPPAPPPP